MENRDRDKVSRNNSSSTDAGEVNRNTSERMHKDRSDSGIDFGEKIGRSEEGLSSGTGRSSGSGSMGSSSGNRSDTGGRH